jgi:hypothetical protein
MDDVRDLVDRTRANARYWKRAGVEGVRTRGQGDTRCTPALRKNYFFSGFASAMEATLMTSPCIEP